MEAAASVAGLAALAIRIAKILHQYSSDVRSYSQDVESLILEVHSLSKVLQQLEAFLEQDAGRERSKGAKSVLGSALEACKKTLHDLLRRLESKQNSTLKKLTWPFHKVQVQNLAESLQRFNMIFQFSLTVEGWWVFYLSPKSRLSLLAESLHKPHKTRRLY